MATVVFKPLHLVTEQTVPQDCERDLISEVAYSALEDASKVVFAGVSETKEPYFIIHSNTDEAAYYPLWQRQAHFLAEYYGLSEATVTSLLSQVVALGFITESHESISRIENDTINGIALIDVETSFSVIERLRKSWTNTYCIENASELLCALLEELSAVALKHGPEYVEHLFLNGEQGLEPNIIIAYDFGLFQGTSLTTFLNSYRNGARLFESLNFLHRPSPTARFCGTSQETFSLSIEIGERDVKCGINLVLKNEIDQGYFSLGLKPLHDGLAIVSIQGRSTEKSHKDASRFQERVKETFGLSAQQFLILAALYIAEQLDYPYVANYSGSSNLWFAHHQSKVNPDQVCKQHFFPLGFTLDETQSPDRWVMSTKTLSQQLIAPAHINILARHLALELIQPHGKK